MVTTTTVPDEARTTASPHRLALVMVSLALALVPVQLDGMVASTALSTIAGDLGGFDRLAWIAAGYLLTMAIGTVVAGRIGDLFGRKGVLLAALATFLAGSVWAGLAGTMDQLVAARAVQGLGAGMTFTTLIAVVADVVPLEKRSRYQAILGAVAPVSMIVGPWVGGMVTDHLGWRWIFLLNVPLVALAIVGALALLRLPSGRGSGRVDAAGLAAAAVTSTGIVLAVTWGGHEHPWGSWQVLGAFAVAALGVVALVAAERRAADPVLPLDLFRNRSVVLSMVVMATGMGAVLMSAVNYLPAFLELVQGRSASSSGLLALPLLLPAIATAALVGLWTTRLSRFRPAMVLGTTVLVVACVLLARMGVGTPAAATVAWMVVTGIGLGMLFQTPLVLVQDAAPADEVGAATGATMFVRMLGGAVGVGAMGSVFASTVADRLGSAAAGGGDISSLTPAQVAALPDAVRETVRSAVAAGSSALFWIAAAVALVGLLAALALPRVRDRGETAEPAVVA